MSGRFLTRGARSRWAKQLPTPLERWAVVRGDEVEITAGREKGKTGKVLDVLRLRQRVVVEGLNLCV